MRPLWLLFSQAVTVGVALVFVVATLKPGWWPPAPAPTASTATAAAWRPALTIPLPAPAASPAADRLEAGGPHSFSAAVRRAAPAVVSITASRLPPRHGAAQEGWQRWFGGDMPRDRAHATQTGLGSGVLVTADGYLLTNQHVVEGADDIEVTLADGRAASARMVGMDAESDLAVLKIDLLPVPAMAFGQAERLQVGDPVLAIGNPFNVGQTVTSGIVSALDRPQLGLSAIANFIQTDAAINPGNSGGALVDSQGRLVGINTAIFSRSGGNMGIGFAIPVDTAREVMDALIRDGQVVRGWIGVQPRDLTVEFADSFQLPVREGVLITGIVQDGPAAKAGLRPGDVVVALAGVALHDTQTLLRGISQLRPPAVARLQVQRGGARLQIDVPVARRPPRPRED